MYFKQSTERGTKLSRKSSHFSLHLNFHEDSLLFISEGGRGQKLTKFVDGVEIPMRLDTSILLFYEIQGNPSI